MRREMMSQIMGAATALLMASCVADDVALDDDALDDDALAAEDSADVEELSPRDTAMVALLETMPLEELLDPAGVGLSAEEGDEIALVRRNAADAAEGDALAVLMALRARPLGAAIEAKLAAWAEAEGLFEPGAVTRHEVAMVPIDCASLSEDELAVAIEHGSCIADGESTFRSAVDGNCGRSTFYIYGGGDWNVKQFAISLRSSRGPIGFVTYRVKWWNIATGRDSSIWGVGNPDGVTWSKVRDVRTGSGQTCAQLSGHVFFAFQQGCSIMHPQDCSQV